MSNNLIYPVFASNHLHRRLLSIIIHTGAYFPKHFLTVVSLSRILFFTSPIFFIEDYHVRRNSLPVLISRDAIKCYQINCEYYTCLAFACAKVQEVISVYQYVVQSGLTGCGDSELSSGFCVLDLHILALLNLFGYRL